MSSPEVHKAPLGPFLARNPFNGPYTDGLYFRDKMRAIHAIAPDSAVQHLLEVGGGRSGLSAMLYPRARVTNIDMDPTVAAAPGNRGATRFVTGSATDLPFPDSTFDIVTMFDLLEHVPDDGKAAREAMRVLRPGGSVLVTTPDRDRWKYPYYQVFKPICPPEEQLFAEWGHVRRGYTQPELDTIFNQRAETTAAFVNPWLAVSHDIAFSRLPRRVRTVLHAAVSPISLVGWFVFGPDSPGTEIAARWRKTA